MTNTVLITGASSGIGRATAILFAQWGWNVAATMRDPDQAGDLAASPTVTVPHLDVLDRASINAAVASTTERFGSIDVLVNNAGYAVLGPLEAIPPTSVERQFATNVLGLIATTQAVLPHFRAQGHGLVVNVSSVVGRMTLPLGSIYDATKFAVEGLSEALRFELEAIGAQVKVVEPGLVATDFGTRSMEFHAGAELKEYRPIVQALAQAAQGMAAEAEPPAVVAEAIWQAATNGSPQLRHPAGETAMRMLAERAGLGDEELHARTCERFRLRPRALSRHRASAGESKSTKDANVEADMALLRRLYADVDDASVEAGHLAAHFAEDFVDFDRNPASPAHLSDREAHLAFFDELKRGFADFSHELNLVAPLPDGKVVVYWTFEGVHRGAFFGAPESGRRARTNGIDIYTLRGGQVVEQRHCEDVAGLMAQIAPKRLVGPTA